MAGPVVLRRLALVLTAILLLTLFSLVGAPLLGLSAGRAYAADAWAAQTSGTDNSLFSVTFIDAKRGWAVGEGGTILRTVDAGAHWRVQASGTGRDLYSVTFRGVTRGWIVGGSAAGSIILRTVDGGAHWNAVTGTTYNRLYSVAFVDALRGWAVGTAGTVLKTVDGGAHWRAQGSGTHDDLRSVFFLDATHGWAVGSDGEASSIILKTVDGGAHWAAQKSGIDAGLSSVTFTDASHGWVVGSDGKSSVDPPVVLILKTADGGVSWTPEKSGGVEDSLSSATFSDAMHGWAVGVGGSVLKTVDGGRRWTAQNSGTGSWLESVTFPDPVHGWAVGDDGTIVAFNGPATSGTPYLWVLATLVVLLAIGGVRIALKRRMRDPAMAPPAEIAPASRELTVDNVQPGFAGLASESWRLARLVAVGLAWGAPLLLAGLVNDNPGVALHPRLAHAIALAQWPLLLVMPFATVGGVIAVSLFSKRVHRFGASSTLALVVCGALAAAMYALFVSEASQLGVSTSASFLFTAQAALLLTLLVAGAAVTVSPLWRRFRWPALLWPLLWVLAIALVAFALQPTAAFAGEDDLGAGLLIVIGGGVLLACSLAAGALAFLVTGLLARRRSSTAREMQRPTDSGSGDT